MPRKPLTAEQREAHRKANRAYAARKTEADREAANRQKRESHRRHKHARNERRTARRERDWQRERETFEQALIRIFGDRMKFASLVSDNNIKKDRTIWKGPGRKRERQLEAQADRILASAAKKRGPT